MGGDRPAVRFRVLGPLVIEGLERSPRAMQQRLLLAALLVAPGRPVGRSVLADVVWAGVPPADARSGLQVLVARLRRELATVGVSIETTDEGYRLAVAPDEVDHPRFRAVADRSDADRRDLDEALARWRGPPFGDLGDTPFLRTVAHELTLAHERLTARLHELRLASGEGAVLLPALARWAEDHPLDEAAWCRWSAALAASGRTAESLRVLRTLRHTLATVTGLEPSPSVVALEHGLLTGGGDILGTGRAVAGRPLATTEMVGRQPELGELRRLSDEHRLVTLVGVGGVGKTRLAVATTEGGVGLAAGDVQWCDLASLTEPTSVASTVCAACGVRQLADRSPTESLAAGIASRRLLLVLDNCEHVLDEVRSLVAAVLRGCPNAHVLATSRQPLDLGGEIVFRLGPLAALDDDGRPGPAAELFVVRARERGCRLPSDDRTMDSVVDVCRRLDGLPLAVELAAARTIVLTPAEIAARLDRSFEILRLPHAPLGGLPRHQTLIAAIAWSYDLLDPPERALLERLSIFAGSFALDVADCICGAEQQGPESMLELLEALVDRSLVVVDDSVLGKRYRLLDTIRRFAAERLAEHGDTRQLRIRHDQWFRAIAAESGRGARSDELVTWQRRFDADLANLRATFEDLLGAGDVDGCQALVADLRPIVVGDSSFVLTDWAPAALALAPDHIGPATAAARAAAAWGAVVNGDYDGAETFGAQALEAVAAGSADDGSAANVVAVQSMFTRRGRQHAALVAECELRSARVAGDLERLVRALAYRYFTRSGDENEQRRRDALEAVEKARALGHPGHLGLTLCHLAWQRHRDGDDGAGALANEAAAMSSLARDDVMYSYAMHLLGAIAHEQGRPDEALDHIANALRCWRRSGDARAWVALRQIAELLADVGDPETATILAAGIGDRNLGAQVHLRPETLADAGAVIEPERRQRLLAEGARRDLDELIALAMREIRQRLSVETERGARHHDG